MAQTTRQHASCVQLPGGSAVLITGPSGAGKSTLALMLIERFDAALIADDQTLLTQPSDGKLMPSCPPVLNGMLEVRGVGFVHYPPPPKIAPVVLMIALTPDHTPPPERLPVPQTVELAGVSLPIFRLGPLDFATADRVMAAYRLTIQGKTRQAGQVASVISPMTTSDP